MVVMLWKIAADSDNIQSCEKLSEQEGGKW
jgi:hypothetical protein